jgi:alkylhydroperoxidase family enzyme
MTSRIDVLEPGQSDDRDVNEFLAESESEWYGDSAFFGAMAHEPELFKRIVSAFEAFPRSDRIDPATLELMRLKIATHNQCAYCSTVRTKAVEEEVAEKEAAVFGDTIDAEALTREEELAVRLAAGMADDPHEFTDDFFEELSEVYTDAEISELLVFAGLEVGLDRFCIALTLDTIGESDYPTNLDYPAESEPRNVED